MTTIFALLLIFQLKHFLADYPLQRGYMLRKFMKTGWVLPLACHCAVHAVMTFAICLFYTDLSWAVELAYFDFLIHFIMDRIKADQQLLGRYKPLTKDTYPTADAAAKRSNDRFWWSLGFDQAVHHLTHYAIIGCLVTQCLTS